jgi:sulfite exporter TauE/SafE
LPPKVVKTITGPHGTTAVTSQEKVRVWMQVVVSVILLVSGILILASPNFVFHQSLDEATKKLAAGWVGGVIGYWLS